VGHVDRGDARGLFRRGEKIALAALATDQAAQEQGAYGGIRDPHAEHMVLMDALFNIAMPDTAAPQLVQAATFCEYEVSRQQSVAGDLRSRGVDGLTTSSRTWLSCTFDMAR